MIEVRYPSVLTKEQMYDFKKNWGKPFVNENKPIYLLDSYIMVSPVIGDECRLFVYSYYKNKILIGEFKPDHGCVWGDHGVKGYYPIIQFYNQLNYVSGHCAYNIGVPNNTRIECNRSTDPEEDVIIINEESLLKCVRDSYDYLKLFDTKE